MHSGRKCGKHFWSLTPAYSHLTEGLAQNHCGETQFLRCRKTKVTCAVQSQGWRLPGPHARTLKSGWNAQFCGMNVLDFKLSNLLNSQTLEISQSFVCSNRIRDCQKKSVSKKLYLGNLHHRTLGGSIWQLSQSPSIQNTDWGENKFPYTGV